VQQILSSPVDKWGLKALLYEIKTQMGKGDRGVLLFGEELSELGVDVTSEEWVVGVQRKRVPAAQAVLTLVAHCTRHS
jgi:hypothetical protein